MLLKSILFGVFGVMQFVYVVRGSKNTLLSTYCVHYCCSSMFCFSEMRRFLQSSSLWEARCALIASYPVHCDWPNTSNVWRKCYSPYHVVCDAVSRRDETITIKPLLKTDVWIVSSKIIKFQNLLTSEAPDCYCGVGIAPLYSIYNHS